MTDASLIAPGAESAPRRTADGAIFHPLLDFLLLGGLTLIVIPIALMLPVEHRPVMSGLMIVLADFLNHPHFAASYQIFYRGYREKAFGTRLSRALRLRYIFAGIVVPVALVLYFATAAVVESAAMFGYSANLMFFLVGWHYTKQGYGMLVVSSVYQKKFFGETDKKLFLLNAYTTWILFWMVGNRMIHERDFFGLSYYSFPIPDWALYGTGAAVAVTSALVLRIFVRRAMTGLDSLPWLGVMAYVVSIYVWLTAMRMPVILILVPALHSLQYLTIVWRYEINRARATSHEGCGLSWKLKVIGFVVWSILLGMAGFWILPEFLEAQVDYGSTALGGGLFFMFSFWTFINIQHYCMDNVIWRKENPDTGAYLFGVKKKD